MHFSAFFGAMFMVTSSSGTHDYGVEIIADAISHVVTCTHMTFDIDKIDAFAAKHQVDMKEGSSDVPLILAIGERKRLALAKVPMTTVCTQGWYFYGPKGVRQPGLLWR